MAWHDRHGHRRILVSASLAVYLEPFGRLTGFDQVIATGSRSRPRRAAHRPSGRPQRAGPAEGHPPGRESWPGPVELWAYGDSAGDREMLAMADHPFLVGRGRRLARRSVTASSVDGHRSARLSG